MIRFLILLGIGYFGYKIIRFWILQHTSLNRPISSKSAGQIDDIMDGKPPRPPADWDDPESSAGSGDSGSKSSDEKPDSKIGGPAGQH